jgi:predicted kinase
MATLVITRGLPGSGKTTWARAWVRGDPEHRARVNRDDLRSMLHGSEWSQQKEFQVQAVRDAAIRRLLDRGISVVCDDTNLPSRTARDLRKLALLAGAEFQVQDMTDVALVVCLDRNQRRKDKAPVPEDWINTQFWKYIRDRPHPLPIMDEPGDGEDGWIPYEPDSSLPKAVLVDIDGTIALKGDRSPYDESRVHEDRYNEVVIQAAVAMAQANDATLILVSGRTEACREATVMWLAGHILMEDVKALFMRPAGDGRKDSDIKYEIFNEKIRSNFNVLCVFDDRNQVVKMWRAIGLPVFQVADGDF